VGELRIALSMQIANQPWFTLYSMW